MACRGVENILVNESQHELVLESHELDHGIWSPTGPMPARIAPGATARWGSESNGFMTGTEGTAIYKVGSTGARLTIYWDNPFIGDNEFKQTFAQPSAGGGPGVPHYVPFDPMRPDGGKTPSGEDAPPQFESGHNVTITFRFIDQEQPVADPIARQGSTPAPEEPRVAAVSTGSTTTVQCPTGFRRLVYIGLGPLSPGHESKQLSMQLKPTEGTLITSASYSWVLNDVEFERRTPLLNGKRADIKALEDAVDKFDYTGPSPCIVDPKLRKWPLRALAAVFAECDSDLNPKADCLALKRLIISSHHSAGWAGGRESMFWGSLHHDSPPTDMLSGYDEGGNVCVLQGLSQMFPKAFLQVEDLCFSACYTAAPNSPVPPGFFKMFKNLKTVFGYQNTSPGAGDASSTPGLTTSNRAIADWEKASRPAGSVAAIQEASNRIRASLKKINRLEGLGKSVVWDQGSPLEPNP